MYNGSTRLLDQFIAHISVERGLARATVRAYESDLRRYLSWLAHTRGNCVALIDADLQNPPEEIPKTTFF